MIAEWVANCHDLASGEGKTGTGKRKARYRQAARTTRQGAGYSALGYRCSVQGDSGAVEGDQRTEVFLDCQQSANGLVTPPSLGGNASDR